MNSRAPSTFSSLRTQPGDDLLRRGVALVARLQRDEHAAVVAAAPAAAADRHGDRGDVGIGLHDLAELLLMALHVGEGNVLRRLPRSPVIRPVSCCGKKPFGMMTNR